MIQRPASGSVLGIDVGFSKTRASSAVCRLSWTPDSISWQAQHFRLNEDNGRETILGVVANHPLLAVALDGPICGTLEIINTYRPAEAMLTRRLQPFIGKPGASNVQVGRDLNNQTNVFAQLLLETCQIAPALHPHSIHDKSIMEAFPSSFLGLMLTQEDALDLKPHIQRGNRSDCYYQHLTQNGCLKQLLTHLLPNRSIHHNPALLKNHDQRAAFICALTALCVTAGDYTAVGDDQFGWIILPPASFIQPCAMELLKANEPEIVSDFNLSSRCLVSVPTQSSPAGPLPGQ